MAAAVLPPSKRQRLGVPEGTPPQANLQKIGKDVFSVLELWKRVHNAALEPIAPSAVTNHLKDLAQGHVAAQCALASVLPRILKKVAVSKVVQLETVSAILGEIHTAPQSVQDTAADTVLPVVRGLLCHESLDSVGADSIKDTFKTLALSILVMHSTCEKHADTLISIASAAFECRPYWFIIALTDALEDGDHAALRGAVAFGKRKLLSGGPKNSFFMEVMSTDSTAASQAAMLLRSCINEVRGKPQLADSLQIMLELDQLLDSSGPTPASDAMPPTSTVLPALGVQWPPVRARESRFSAPEQTVLQSPGLPGPPPPPRQTGMLDSAALPSAPPRRATLSPHNSDVLPPPPKRRSTPPMSRSPSPVRGSPARSDGYNASPTPAAAAVWRPQPSLSRVTARQMLGESGQLDCRAARVSPTLGLSGLPHRVSSRDLCRALPSQRELAHIEVLPEKCAIVQFSCMQAALGCLMGLGNSLNQLGWRYSALGLAHHSFAVSAAPAQHWVWVACAGTRDSLVGILHICHHAGVPSPSKHYLVQHPAAKPQHGCLLQFETAQSADDCAACVLQWQQDQLNSDQPEEDQPEEDAAEDSRHSKDSAMSPDAWHSEPESGPVWRGSVAKSAVRQCAVCVQSASPVMARGCQIWQDSLDVQHRTTIPQAVQAWQEHAEEHRGSAWLHPDGDEGARFATFVQYLTDRNRAGIARPANPGAVVHTVYLIPASPEICETVNITADESSGLLLLMIVNQAVPQ